jgi:hypothetical protein
LRDFLHAPPALGLGGGQSDPVIGLSQNWIPLLFALSLEKRSGRAHGLTSSATLFGAEVHRPGQVATDGSRVSIPKELVADASGPLYIRSRSFSETKAYLSGQEEILNHLFNLVFPTMLSVTSRRAMTFQADIFLGSRFVLTITGLCSSSMKRCCTSISSNSILGRPLGFPDWALLEAGKFVVIHVDHGSWFG